MSDKEEYDELESSYADDMYSLDGLLPDDILEYLVPSVSSYLRLSQELPEESRKEIFDALRVELENKWKMELKLQEFEKKGRAMMAGDL